MIIQVLMKYNGQQKNNDQEHVLFKSKHKFRKLREHCAEQIATSCTETHHMQIAGNKKERENLFQRKSEKDFATY